MLKIFIGIFYCLYTNFALSSNGESVDQIKKNLESLKITNKNEYDKTDEKESIYQEIKDSLTPNDIYGEGL